MEQLSGGMVGVELLKFLWLQRLSEGTQAILGYTNGGQNTQGARTPGGRGTVSPVHQRDETLEAISRFYAKCGHTDDGSECSAFVKAVATHRSTTPREMPRTEVHTVLRCVLVPP